MRLLEDVLAEEILSGRVGEGDTAMVDVDEEGKVKIIPQKTQELLPSS
jgi:ATP-dependent Clp protease ATP-binding subunit ClpC